MDFQNAVGREVPVLIVSEVQERKRPRKLPLLAYFRAFLEYPLAPMLDPMTRRLHNWTYRDVTDFLKENGFSFIKELGGSHQAWGTLDEMGKPARLVGIDFRHGTYLVGTLKRIIHQSGIPEEAWIEWANS